MARKDRSTINRDRSRLYKIHGECVRRNSLYAKQYDNVMELLAKAGNTFMPVQALESDWGLYHNEPLPNPHDRPPLERLMVEEQSSPEPIYLPGDLAIDERIDRAFQELSFRFLDLRLKPEVMAGMLVLTYYPQDRPNNPRHTVIDTRWSKKDMLENFQDWVNKIVDERRKVGLKQATPNHRLRLNEYADYLKAYDLRADGKSYKRIGKIMWGDDEGDLKKKAVEYVRRGEELVKYPPLVPKGKRPN